MTFWGTQSVCSLFLSLMLVFLVSDALLLPLSWCIRGENTICHLNLNVSHGFQPRKIPFFLYISSRFTNSPQGASGGGGPPGTPIMPSPAGQCFPQLNCSPSPLSCNIQSHWRVWLLLFPDSNNSGDNLYTMINTGPGNRNNVSLFFFSPSF